MLISATVIWNHAPVLPHLLITGLFRIKLVSSLIIKVRANIYRMLSVCQAIFKAPYMYYYNLYKKPNEEGVILIIDREIEAQRG